MSDKDEMELLPDPETIEERRSRVKEMMLRGIRIVTMASILGCDRETIRFDVQAVREAIRAKYKTLDARVEIGECAENLDMIARRAALEAEKTKNKRMRNSFLNTSIRAFVAKAHVLSDPSVVPMAMGGLAAVTKIDGGDYSDQVKAVLKDSNSRRRLLGVLSQVIKQSRPKALLEAKFVELKPTEPPNGDQV